MSGTGGPSVKTSLSSVRVVSLIPSWGAKIPMLLMATKQKTVKQKEYFNKFNKGV